MLKGSITNVMLITERDIRQSKKPEPLKTGTRKSEPLIADVCRLCKYSVKCIA